MKKFERFLENMIGISIYALIFAVLLGIAVPTLSTREYFGFAYILGFFAGLINNLERVLRELLDKRFKKEE
jgi:hypothetical protein